MVLTGGAGLVGQNLVVRLKEKGYKNLLVIDKHAHNLAILSTMHPDVSTITADLAEPGTWIESLQGCACLIMLQARITGKTREAFIHDTIDSTRAVLGAVHKWQIPYIVHISSSVVVSAADDDYTQTKKDQEKMVVESGIKYCVLRPTLMFGWFDPKHLGWLARFMEKTPVFPIPGDGRFMRQPLYNKDFCEMIIHCMEQQPEATVYDIVGDQKIDYIDIIRAIKKVKRLKTLIIKLPMWFFALLMRIYALFSKYPPFTVDQLKALTAGDDFKGIDTEKQFGIKQTPFEQAIDETYNDKRYAKVSLQRTGIGK
ncbi:NAD-dependent epimerase/dehydratase family protein [Candidatus Venteria ishoeyi]|uniref:NAD-dependent epimerase/dehydratase family protein n=1 Tax=Candidatus Venteria ishoeyi TaxID=1899563 RepID=UPI00255D0D11|nr:NAD-dependent epimerase/dehydratase family protein [Candidatus Venteria ishoeyi]